MKICLINFASRRGWFPQGQKRLQESFVRNGFSDDFRFYDNEIVLQCPTHGEVPYAFKAYAMMNAYKLKYDIIIWADASIQLLKPFSRVLDHINEHKYMLLLNGWTSGEWCADTALEPLGITREESFTYPHIMACVMGLDMREEMCVKFLQEYYDRAADGITFKGAWSNENHQVSNNDRVLGHRHDQTAASIIAWRLGMKHFATNLLYYYGDTNPLPESILFVNKGGH